MLLVVRPTSGDGRIPIRELDTILPMIGFDFLKESVDKLKPKLDPTNSGFF